MVKKQLIMENALELFAKQGFEATSIQQITDKCGISKGAFYLSFKSKDELILSLIDYFMSEIAADVERVVNSDLPTSQLLYSYYYQSFDSFRKYAHFAQLFIKEQNATCSSIEIFEKLEIYHNILNHFVHTIVKKQFDYVEEHMVPDLIFTIQTFIGDYIGFFIKENINISSDIDMDTLCRSLVEKVTIIAKYAKIPFFSPELNPAAQASAVSLTKEELILFLEKKLEEIDDSVVHESIEILHQHLLSPSLSPAVEQGLLKNLRANSHSKWIAYMYEISTKS
ncbi:TetR/AcrR family transcriptional regulator [Lysinibacillus sp. KU-BSD001]|uniref:TetR/AcrR family transcriptional regulator n=1 Tax=Lysinibacillus sp. KU-BSD001 TaxID=3141328 RepID=UPI0036EB3AF4